MPVAAVVGAAEGAEAFGRPGDDVGRAGRDVLPAAGAQVGLRRGRPRHRPHTPVAVRMPLEPAAAMDEPRLEIVHRRVRGWADTTATGTVAAGHDV